jgi:hypothetical protein
MHGVHTNNGDITRVFLAILVKNNTKLEQKKNNKGGAKL